jgi:hypothetical protein
VELKEQIFYLLTSGSYSGCLMRALLLHCFEIEASIEKE